MSEWKDNFRAYTMRMNFQLALTRPMMEFLCAVAEDVWWDRSIYRDHDRTAPDNFIASSHALVKRGLIELKKNYRAARWQNVYEIRSRYELTPAGKAVVNLLKITGLFVQADNAILRKSKA